MTNRRRDHYLNDFVNRLALQSCCYFEILALKRFSFFFFFWSDLDLRGINLLLFIDQV